MYPQRVEQCLTSVKSSINICWRNESLLHIHSRAPLGFSRVSWFSHPWTSLQLWSTMESHHSPQPISEPCRSSTHFSTQLQCNPNPVSEASLFISKSGWQYLWCPWTFLPLPSLSSYCSLHDRPTIERRAFGAKHNDFIQEASWPRR